MMNKKAIAAFAAGATLLAGFAMATPAFAAETPTAPKITKSQAAKDVKTAKDNLDKAKGELDALKAGKEEAKAPATTDIAADALAKCYTKDVKTGKLTPVEAEINKLTMAVGPKVTAYINQFNAHLDYTKKAEEVQKLEDAYNKALREQADAVDDPTTPSEEETKDAAIARVRTAKADLDTKRVKKSKTYAEYLKKKSALRSAKDAFDRQDQAVKDAEEALEKFDMSGKTDSAARKNLENRRDRAKSLRSAAALKVTKAQSEYDDAEAKATDAKTLWENAVTEYHNAYEAAVALGVDPAKLPLVSTAEDPLENDFSDVPGVLKVVEDAKAGKFGPEAQAAAQQGQAGKAGANGSAAAGAKTEVENKNGKDKRGNTHTGTGVGVTLTALAATMLAGMGAAVRKARH
ncbi:hypothetical protein ACMZ79_03000 [Gardnerella vaginalis]|uniref:hypothetical protein n=1 Tax=Gardnerella vaginalis TaxID=2702 RepID=UPI0039EEA415